MTSNNNESLLVCDSDLDCRHDGVCMFDVEKMMTSSDGSYVLGSHCKCEAGYMGSYCENMCTHKCLNGGQCVHMIDEITNSTTSKVICACPTDFSGSFCEIDDVLEAKNSAAAAADNNNSNTNGKSSTVSPILIVVSCFIGIVLFVTYRRRQRHMKNRERTIWNSGILTNPKYSYEQRSAMARLAALGSATSTSLSVLHTTTMDDDDINNNNNHTNLYVDEVGESSKQQHSNNNTNTSFT